MMPLSFSRNGEEACWPYSPLQEEEVRAACNVASPFEVEGPRDPELPNSQPVRPMPVQADAGGACPRQAAQAAGREFLGYLSGLRCLLCLWILADHTIHGSSLFTDRANVAVDFFIILSGFVTHWAYGTRDFRTRWSVAQFYARRLGRVLFTVYLAMTISALKVVVTEVPMDLPHLLRCFLFVEPWLDPENWCPDGPMWTIAALIPSWLLYPASKLLLIAVANHGGDRGLLVLLCSLWTSSLGPSLLVFVMQGGSLSLHQHNYAYVWPPSQLADFGIGAVAAALAQRHSGGGCKEDCVANPWLRGFAADVAFFLTLLVVFLKPSTGYHVGSEPLLNHGLAPLLATFLFGSSAAGSAGLVAKLFTLEPFQFIGKYSFQIFVFQEPTFSLFEVVWIAGLNELLPITYFGIIYGLTLLFLSGLYANFVEAHFVRWLRARTASWA